MKTGEVRGRDLLKNSVMLGFFLVVPILLGTTLSIAGANACEPNGRVTQVSSLQALMDGTYTVGLTMEELSDHGNFGLGTFGYVDGEMILLDGTVYRAAHDGTVSRAESFRLTPFAVTHPFEPDDRWTVEAIGTFDDLKERLSDRYPGGYGIRAFRIEGRFAHLRVRSVPRQEQPGVPLDQVVDQENVFELEDVEASLVGYRFPSYMEGVNAPGYHFHAVTADRTRGGHLYELSIREARIEQQRLRSLQILHLESDEPDE